MATTGVAIGVLSDVLPRPLSLADGECERDGGDCVDSSFSVLGWNCGIKGGWGAGGGREGCKGGGVGVWSTAAVRASPVRLGRSCTESQSSNVILAGLLRVTGCLRWLAAATSGADVATTEEPGCYLSATITTNQSCAGGWDS